ncbi:MAG TPA: hypothetical protein VFV08_10700, partial [Puia sp.]|nr:hypothetical protein [Puia sp.]
YGIDINKLSAGIKRLIENYEQTKETIGKLQDKLAKPGITDTKKASYEADLKEANELLEKINEALIAKIQTWQDNHAANVERGKKLAESRKAAKTNSNGQQGSGQPAATSTVNEPSTGQPAAASAGEEPQGTGQPAATSTVNEPSTGQPAPVVKKKTPWGFIIAGALIITSVIVAVTTHTNSQKKAA